MIKSNLRILMAEQRIDDVSELMQRSGLSRNAINRLYKEKEGEIEGSTLKTLITLCNTLGCKLSDLIEYTPEEDNKHE